MVDGLGQTRPSYVKMKKKNDKEKKNEDFDEF